MGRIQLKRPPHGEREGDDKVARSIRGHGREGIQELNKQMKDMGLNMEQREKAMEARMEDHIRKMEQR